MTTTTPGFDGTEHAETGPSSTEWLTSPATADPTPPPRKPWHKRTWVRVTAGLVATPIVIGVIASAAGGSHPAAAPAKPASSAPASPAKPAEPATASGYLIAHGYTVVEKWSNAKWQAENKNAAPYDKFIADGSDVVAAGSDSSHVLIVVKVTDDSIAHISESGGLAEVIAGMNAKLSKDSSVKLDGHYLVASMPMPTSGDSGSAAAGTNPAPAASQPAAPATSAPAAPAGPTVSQQQALDAAQSYLQMGSGFSRAGLIAQLDSPDGNKFSVADATWAADHSGADWNAQAVMAAQGYMKLGGFSRSSLIDQLDSPYGGQFTLAQATYAANQVGL